MTTNDTTTNAAPTFINLAKGQIWSDKEGTQARVLGVGFQVGNGRRRSVCSMMDAEYVKYFNLRTRRQSTARLGTFRDKFTTLVQS